MIAFIKGIMTGAWDETAVIEVNGIGYMLEVSSSTFGHLPPIGTEVKLYTHLITREDGLFLYGFQEQNELQLFRFLISVGGVGPKAAMGLFSVFAPETIHSAVLEENADLLRQAPGIGRKTAERIILELRDKLKKYIPAGKTVNKGSRVNEENDAIAALAALGYSETEAQKAVQQALISAGNSNTTAELVRIALRQIGASRQNQAVRNRGGFTGND